MDLLEVIAEFAPGGEAESIQESWFDSGFYDPDIDLTAAQGGAAYFRRITQSPADLSPLIQTRMQELALYLYDKNPLAKRCLELIRDAVVGNGFSVESKDTAAQEVIDRFWKDGVNDMSTRIHDGVLELGLYGELAILVFVNERSGHVRCVTVDPRTIEAAITKPGSPDVTLAIKIAGPTGTEERYVKVINENDSGMMIGAAPGETLTPGKGRVPVPYYTPEGLDPSTRLVGCFFEAINKTRAATRGRSDLLSVMDFVDMYDRLVFDEAERMSFLRAFVYDVEVKGADAGELLKKAMNEPPPKPGSVKYHNENERWTAVTPQLGAQDGATTADLILSLIATGVGVPKTWLNGSMDVNKAMAYAMDDPAIRRLKARQNRVIMMIRRIVRFVLDQAEMAGALKPAGDERHQFSINTPEISGRDLEKGARSLFSSIQALGMGKAALWVDDETAVQALSIMLGELGVHIETDELQKRLDKMKTEREQAENTAGDRSIPAYLGVGGQFGSDQLTKAIDDKPDKSGQRATADGQLGTQPAAAGLDPKSVTGMIAQVSGALVQLGTAGVIDVEVAQDIVVKFFEPLGISIDVEAMRARIKKDEAENAEGVPT